MLDPRLGDEDYCYLTTTGRVTAKPHQIEIWFGHAPGTDTIYILAGGRHDADFIRNAKKQPAVIIRIRDHTFDAIARIVPPDDAEDALARRLLLEKYSPPGYTGGDLDEWGRTALALAVDLQVD